ncbi:DM13 domain-containing protein [Candidatus Parcubacteria bacterium]|nr:DM13 domain-containing protein [Candidatus Parcubacteria bacterium]
MTKALIIIIALVIAGVGIYYGRFLFTKKVVKEDIPAEMIAASQVVRTGTFVEIDFVHKGSGAAKIIEGTNGHRLLRLENFQVTNGPDLYVYLTKNSSPTGNIKSLGDFINLGRLKGNVGDQNYEITQNVDGYNTAVIWCRQFGALFSYAVLK